MLIWKTLPAKCGKSLSGLARDCNGATMIEYALIGAFVALVVIAGVGLVGQGLNNFFLQLAAAL